MRKILYAVCALVVLWSAICAAEADTYKDTIDRMSGKAEELAPYLNSNKLDCPIYNKWYEEFKKISEEFAKTFSGTHKKRTSFQLARQAIDELSLAWNMLRSAQEADEMYVESITSNADDAGYAHGWKKTALNNRKNAGVSITKGINFFKDAKASLKNEASE
ncbi:MAG: hypothetical protein NTY34_01665 [Candidatus Omnitrophica bacterium]|nr:hypothetical protein [Candidatus Omnitrophota bacterium]